MDFIRRTHTVVHFLVALTAAGHDFGLQLTDGFHVTVKATKRTLGLVKIEPWRSRSTAAIARAVSVAAAWVVRLLRFRVPALAAAAAVMALLVADLSATDRLMLAIPPVLVSVMTLDQLRTERAQLVREAEALSGADGTFQTDAARAAGDTARPDFDAKMARVREIDARIAELERAGAPAPASDATARAAGAAAERERITGITEAVRIAKLPVGDAADMIGRGISLDAARAEIFTKLAAKDASQPTNSQVRMGDDAADKWARGAMSWLLVRSGLAALVAKHEGTEASKVDPGEFRGMSLFDLAKDSLTRANVHVRGMDRMELVAKAFTYRSNYQTPSDFTTLLENTLHKVLKAAYGITPDTWSRWCATATVSDFRTHNWYRTGALSELDTLNDVGEFKNKAIPDGEKVTHSVGTRGNIVGISRQTIINDDLGAVMQMMQRLGRAGKLTIEKMAYALLAQNAGLGPTFQGTPLFDATKNNISTGAAISAAAIDADRVTMANQKEPNSNEFADLRPSILLLAVGLGGQARVINQSQYDPDTVANKAQMKPNVVVGLFSDIVDTPRLTGTRRYLFADKDIAPTFVVSFLEGQQEPVLETQDGWRVDGVEMKARLDVGVDAVDFRGAVTNAGV